MPQKKKGQRQPSVENLRAYEPHPTRTHAIRQWHLEQIGHDNPAVALLAVAVTASGLVVTKGRGIDPIHAEIVLEELDNVRAVLKAQILSKASSEKPRVAMLRRVV